ncbi:MAG: DNA-binding protein [Clostridiales bacterium]|nr:DNA-binding protein [Clostridiales bacterium]
MIQPKRDEITNKLKKIINNEITREEVGRWALEFIRNDDTVEVKDIEAWHYLVSVSSIDEMIAPNEYLYSIEDIEGWIAENNEY